MRIQTKLQMLYNSYRHISNPYDQKQIPDKIPEPLWSENDTSEPAHPNISEGQFCFLL